MNLKKGRKMKKNLRITSLALIAFLIVGSGAVMAQRFEQGEMQRKRPNRSQGMQQGMQQGMRHGMQQGMGQNMGIMRNIVLTEEQKTELNTLTAGNQKLMRYESNLLREKQAHLRTLLSASERDEKAIEKTIDNISSAKGDLLKKRIANQEEVKNILTDEQVQQLETSRRGKGNVGQMKSRSMGNRDGKGFGSENNFRGRRFDR